MEENWSEALAQLERVWPRVTGTAEEPGTPPTLSGPLPAERRAAQALLDAAACAGRDAPLLRRLAAECAAAARELAAEAFLEDGAIPGPEAPPRAEGGLLPRLRCAYLALRRAGEAYAAGPASPLRARLAAKKRGQCEAIFALVAARLW